MTDLTTPPRALRVLIIDANPAAGATAHLVRLWGHEVCVTSEPTSALVIAEGFRPDVVVLDLDLPDLAGYALARQLCPQATPAGILLVAISGAADPAHQRLAGEAGIPFRLLKPVDPSVLAELLARRAREVGAAVTPAAAAAQPTRLDLPRKDTKLDRGK
jgi:DNA-binding response OmpR family regulator